MDSSPQKTEMTLQDLFTLFVAYRHAVLLVLFFAPWLALGLCILIPGRQEEPFILNFNLGMASLSLVSAVGYLMFATQNGGWARVVKEADILLMLAPCYYVGVSLWVTRQRLPLEQVPAYRAIQGLALLSVGYLGLAWFLSKIRFLVFSYVPFQVLVLLLLGLVGVIYFGYLRLTGKDLE
ncbi:MULTISPECIES: hypothetical protein [Cyanophyceae]|uniref:Uncharacterized protein n=1 Tax=Leptolyngbya subtilissima DQ-A4 TaxID=2933933 RepID=A0ABV0K346_9CYAN|nr:hypothetical protein [Nodosilinea sp. FACHB-141]